MWPFSRQYQQKMAGFVPFRAIY